MFFHGFNFSYAIYSGVLQRIDKRIKNERRESCYLFSNQSLIIQASAKVNGKLGDEFECLSEQVASGGLRKSAQGFD